MNDHDRIVYQQTGRKPDRKLHGKISGLDWIGLGLLAAAWALVCWGMYALHGW